MCVGISECIPFVLFCSNGKSVLLALPSGERERESKKRKECKYLRSSEIPCPSFCKASGCREEEDEEEGEEKRVQVHFFTSSLVASNSNSRFGPESGSSVTFSSFLDSVTASSLSLALPRSLDGKR